MNMNINIKTNETKGITLIALSIIIIVLLILAGVAVYSGKQIIQEAKLEELKTNMLLIKAKAREYVEDANFKMGINPDDTKKAEVREQVYTSENGAQLKKVEESEIPSSFAISDTTTCYWLTEEAKTKWGLSKMESIEKEYLIRFDEENVEVEVYNKEGYNGKYSLTEIEQIQE